MTYIDITALMTDGLGYLYGRGWDLEGIVYISCEYRYAGESGN